MTFILHLSARRSEHSRDGVPSILTQSSGRWKQVIFVSILSLAESPQAGRSFSDKG